MVQTTEILKILHGMQHDLQAIDQKHTLLLSHTKAQKEKADQDLTAEIAAQEQALKKAETCLIQTRIQIQQDSDKQREQFYEQARQEAVLMSSVIECLEERHIYLKTNDKYFRKYHTKMAPTLQQKIEAAYQDVDDILQEAKSVYDMHETYFSTTGKYRLPVIINGLNYMLSSKRKELYRTLIECYSRAICLKEQLEKNEFLERSFQKLNQDCQMQLQQAEQQYHAAEIRKEQAVNRLQKETVEKKYDVFGAKCHAMGNFFRGSQTDGDISAALRENQQQSSGFIGTAFLRNGRISLWRRHYMGLFKKSSP